MGVWLWPGSTVKDPIAGLVAITGVIVELLKHGREQLKVLKAAEILLFDLGFALPGHSSLSMRHGIQCASKSMARTATPRHDEISPCNE